MPTNTAKMRKDTQTLSAVISQNRRYLAKGLVGGVTRQRNRISQEYIGLPPRVSLQSIGDELKTGFASIRAILRSSQLSSPARVRSAHENSLVILGALGDADKISVPLMCYTSWDRLHEYLVGWHQIHDRIGKRLVEERRYELIDFTNTNPRIIESDTLSTVVERGVQLEMSMIVKYNQILKEGVCPHCGQQNYRGEWISCGRCLRYFKKTKLDNFVPGSSNAGGTKRRKSIDDDNAIAIFFRRVTAVIASDLRCVSVSPPGAHSPPQSLRSSRSR